MVAYAGAMSESSEIRIGTTEREEAMAALSAHFSAGRLNLVEFEDRSGLVAQARTRGDLVAVFSDLPADKVVAEKRAAVPAEPQPGWDWRAGIVAVTPFIALVLFFLTDTWLWFLMIPAAGAIVYGGLRRPANHPAEHRSADPEGTR